MGRFYQTAKPEFVENIIQQPPWELAQQALAVKQLGYDNALQSTDIVRDLLDVQHLNFEDDKVKEIKNTYNTKIDDLVSKIAKDPKNYNKVLPEIKNISREIGSSRKEGDIANIERRAADWQQWQTDNADLKKEDPFTYNRLAQHWYEDIKGRSGKDITAQFAGQQGIAKPNINSKEMRETLENMKANATEVSNGKYKINNKWLSEAEVMQSAYDMYMSDPKVQGYINQQGNILKDPGYYDEETGSLRNVFEQQEDGSMVLNSKHAMSGGFRGLANIFGFSEQSISEDAYGKMAQSNANAMKLQAQKDAQAMKRLAFQAEVGKEKLAQEYELKGKLQRDKIKQELGEDGSAEAVEALRTIYSKETIGTIKNPDYNYEDDFNTVNQNREVTQNPGPGNYFSAIPGTIAYQENYRLSKATNFAKGKISGSSDAKEYLEYLGERRPTEETAKEFLKSKGVYQRPSYENSIAGEFADNSRSSLLRPLKSESAKKWDEIYSIGEKYEDYIKDWYEEEGRKEQQVSLNPISEEGQEILLGELNTGSGNYFTTDEQGNPTGENTTVKQVLGVTGGNSQSNIGYQVLTNDEEVRWVFPAVENANVQELNRNLSLMAVKDKNSAFAKETRNREVNRITTQINRGVDVGGTKSNIVNIAGSDLVIKTTSSGTIEVYDRDGNEKAGEWSSVAQLVDHLYK